MKIKKLNVKSFGKLENKELELRDGFNIVYGENESGKSTLQSFIKVMLYGVDSRKGRKLIGDRVKYTPIGKGEFSGELIIEDEGKEILIDRTFGKTKKYDDGQVIDNVTGEVLREYSWQEVGKDILDVSSEGFRNTLFISQLGCSVENSKQDDILNRIINILESGEDEVSYKKIKSNLEDGKKRITNQRKTGKLDLLRIKEGNLLEERYKRVKIQEENIEDEIILNSLKVKKREISSSIEELENIKDDIKRANVEKDIKEIEKYSLERNELNKELDTLLSNLKKVEPLCNIEKVNNIKAEINYCRELNRTFDEKNKEYFELKKNLEEEKKSLYKYGILNELPQNMESKIIELRVEESNLKENYKVIREIKKELSLLEEKRDDFLSHLNSLKLTDEYANEIEKVLNLYKLKVKEDTEFIGFDNNLDGYENKKRKINIKRMLFRALQLGVIGLGGLFLVKFTKSQDILHLAAIIFSMLIFLYTLAMGKHYKKQLIEIENNISEIKSVNENKSELTSLKRKIEDYKVFLRARTQEDILEALEDYKFVKKELDLLYAEIKGKENSLFMLKEGEIKEKLASNQSFIERLFRVTNSNSLDEILEMIKSKNQEENRLKIKENKLREVETEKDNIFNRLLNRESLIKNAVTKTELEILDLSALEIALEDIIKNIGRVSDIRNKIASLDENCRILLNGRNLNALREIVENKRVYKVDSQFEKEDDVLLKIKEKNNSLINTEKEIKDVEYSISSKELSSRSLYLIDEELEETRLSINSLEKKVKAIDVALKYMEKAFKELQKSFGPVINKKVEEIFEGVTDGTYKDVRVSEDYSLVVRNIDNNSIMDTSYLSSGTYDQIYLALRLGIIDIIFKDKKVPIILDESFTQYDDKRLSRMLDILYEKCREHQIILFTCQKREIEILKDREKVNIIKL